MALKPQAPGRLSVGVGLKRLTQKHQSGQTLDGAQTRSLRRETEGNQVSSLTRKSGRRPLTNQCTFGSGELDPYQ